MGTRGQLSFKHTDRYHQESIQGLGNYECPDGSENDVIHCAQELPDIRILYGDANTDVDDPFCSNLDEDSSTDDWDNGLTQDN